MLGLPLLKGQRALALLAFLGGFSAAMGMVVVSSMTNAVMLTNHVLLPVMDGDTVAGIFSESVKISSALR